MKLSIKKILPFATIATVATAFVPLVSCAKEEKDDVLARINGKIEDGIYEPQNTCKHYKDYSSLEQLNNAYFDDIENNPQIFADDLMNALKYGCAYSDYTMLKNPGIPYEINLELTRIDVNTIKGKTLNQCTVSYKIDLKFVMNVGTLLTYGEGNVEINNYKIALVSLDDVWSSSGLDFGDYYCGYPGMIESLYRAYSIEDSDDTYERELTELRWDKDGSIKYHFMYCVGGTEIARDYLFNSDYVKKATNNDILIMHNVMNEIAFGSYYYCEAGIPE